MEQFKEVSKLFKRIIISLIVVLLFPATALAVDYAQSPETAQDHELVYIPDPVLKKNILDVLKITEDRDVTFGEMKTITSLSAPNGVQDLTGIEYAVNIKTVCAYHNKCTDLEPLRNLSKIDYIQLCAGKFESIEPIAGLHIRHLDLAYCDKVKDLDLIWSMDTIRELELDGLELTSGDLDNLDKLPNLEWISLKENNITDLNFLSKAPKVYRLFITYNKINDISSLKNLQWLRSVTLDHNEIADISPLISAYQNSLNNPVIANREKRYSLWGNYLDESIESPTSEDIKLLNSLMENTNGFFEYSSKSVEVEVQSVSLTSNNITIEPGETLTLDCIIGPDNATVKNVRWYSKNPEIISIDQYKGTITALEEGEAIIEVKTLNKGLSDTCNITVKTKVQPRISEFSVKHNDKTYQADVDQDKLTINLNIEGNTNHFTPSFVLDNPGIVSIDGVIQESGVSVVDFSNPVHYTVKSEDSEEGITYTVTVTGTKVDECFIATACFGSINEPAVKLLRQFRDKFLLTNKPGQEFVSFYYSNSPPLADYIRQSEGKKLATRIILMPLIVIAYISLNPIWLILILVMLTAIILRRRMAVK